MTMVKVKDNKGCGDDDMTSSTVISVPIKFSHSVISLQDIAASEL